LRFGALFDRLFEIRAELTGCLVTVIWLLARALNDILQRRMKPGWAAAVR
jgi:hypothetical protein